MPIELLPLLVIVEDNEPKLLALEEMPAVLLTPVCEVVGTPKLLLDDEEAMVGVPNVGVLELLLADEARAFEVEIILMLELELLLDGMVNVLLDVLDTEAAALEYGFVMYEVVTGYVYVVPPWTTARFCTWANCTFGAKAPLPCTSLQSR